MKPKISFIIVSYNAKEVLSECLQSILDIPQDTFSVQTIVVDNASKDGSREYLKFLSETAKNVCVILNDENVGYGKANNQALQSANGDYIFLLNPDAAITNNAVGTLLAFAQSKKEPVLAAPSLLNIDETVQASCFNLPSVGNAIAEYFFGIEGAYAKFYPRLDKPVIVDAVVGAAMLLPRKLVDELGFLFDEKYFLYYEDIDLCKRMKKKGYSIYYIPTAKVMHRHGVSAKTTGGWAYQQNQKSAKQYFGTSKYFLVTQILKYGQKWQKLLHISRKIHNPRL